MTGGPAIIQGRQGVARLTQRETEVLRVLRAGTIVPFAIPGMSVTCARVHILSIRKKLSAADAQVSIRSVWRKGWQLEERSPGDACHTPVKAYLAQRDALAETQSQHIQALTDEVAALRQRIEVLEAKAATHGLLVTT